MNSVARSLLDGLSSLRLTLACLGAAMVLVFLGTIAQVDHGIHEVQRLYFQSLVVRWHGIPILPGGHLLLAILLANLITAHARRFRWKASKIGIHLIHGGLVVMLVGMLLTDFLAQESQMRLSPGETRRYAEDPRFCELALIDPSAKDHDTVVVIPQALLEQGGIIDHPALPFRIEGLRFLRNARFVQTGEKVTQAASCGLGARNGVISVPPATAPDERDVQAAVIAILPKEGSPTRLESWLVVNDAVERQSFIRDEREWILLLRPARRYLPFSLRLESFTHDLYPGTQIPKNFASRVRMADPEAHEDREAVISMNSPLRHRGITLYQSGFLPGDSGTILQVVRNPGFLAPYLGCLLVGVGMLWQFAYHFLAFLARRRTS